MQARVGIDRDSEHTLPSPAPPDLTDSPTAVASRDDARGCGDHRRACRVGTGAGTRPRLRRLDADWASGPSERPRRPLGPAGPSQSRKGLRTSGRSSAGRGTTATESARTRQLRTGETALSRGRRAGYCWRSRVFSTGSWSGGGGAGFGSAPVHEVFRGAIRSGLRGLVAVVGEVDGDPLVAAPAERTPHVYRSVQRQNPGLYVQPCRRWPLRRWASHAVRCPLSRLADRQQTSHATSRRLGSLPVWKALKRPRAMATLAVASDVKRQHPFSRVREPSDRSRATCSPRATNISGIDAGFPLARNAGSSQMPIHQRTLLTGDHGTGADGRRRQGSSDLGLWGARERVRTDPGVLARSRGRWSRG
jgi:hypothetical protein